MRKLAAAGAGIAALLVGFPAPAPAATRHVWIAAVPTTWNVVPNGRNAIEGERYTAAKTTMRTVVYERFTRDWKRVLPHQERIPGPLTTVRRLHGGRFAVRATARPAQVGTPAALQLYSRERYRWRQVAHARVDRHSRVSFVVSPPGRYAARIVLLRGRGGYGASVGPTKHIGGHGAPRRARPAPHREHHHMPQP